MEKHQGHPTVSGMRSLARTLRNERYDHAITLPGSFRTALTVMLAGIPGRVGWDPGSLLTPQVRAVKYPRATRRLPGVRAILAFESLYRISTPLRYLLPAMYTDVLTQRSGTHRAEQALEALTLFGVDTRAVPSAPWLVMPDAAKMEVEQSLPGIPGGWVVIAPGATQPTRRWPLEHLKELVRQLASNGHQVVIVGAEEDRTVADLLCAGAPRERVRSLAGRISVLAACEIIRRASVVVANDSAPVHMASAMGTPAVALFGPTLSSFGFAPLAPGSIVMERGTLACRPCTVYGSTDCPVGTHECLRSITPDDVLAAVRKILDRSGEHPTGDREGNR
jgi:ADP-heptose:LPS heptosyltransferase